MMNNWPHKGSQFHEFYVVEWVFDCEKAILEVNHNRLASLTQCKSVTDTVEIFGYMNTSYIDKMLLS